MPKRDLNSLQSLLTDLWQETTVIVRLFLFAGMGAGLLFFFWMVSRVEGLGPNDNSLRYALRLLWLIAIAMIVVGGLIGLGLGVVVELIVDRIRPPSKRRPRRRRH